MATQKAIDHYQPGEQPSSFTPGDITLHRAAEGLGTTRLGQVIQAGERVRFGNTDFARWTHSALITSEQGEIYEADSQGVVKAHISKYLRSDYLIVHPKATAVQRRLAVEFVKSKAKAGYGILNFVSIVFQMLLGSKISIHNDREFICSGLVARATEKYIPAYPRSPEVMLPADLAHYWGATSGEPLPSIGFVGKSLNRLMATIWLIRSKQREE